jgi:hypothetical protein
LRARGHEGTRAGHGARGHEGTRARGHEKGYGLRARVGPDKSGPTRAWNRRHCEPPVSARHSPRAMNRKFARRSDLASRPAPRRPRPEAGRGQKPDAENTKEKQREHEEEREYLRAALKTAARSPLCRAAAQRSAFASPPGERCAHFGLRQVVLHQLRKFNDLRYGFMERNGVTKQSSAPAGVLLDCFPRIKSGVAMTPVPCSCGSRLVWTYTSPKPVAFFVPSCPRALVPPCPVPRALVPSCRRSTPLGYT